MNLPGAFALSAQKRGQKAALSWGDVQFSYGDLFTQSLQFARRLEREFQVRPGDRVGLWIKNCPTFVSALFGILEAGAVVVPINSFLKPDEVIFMLDDAGIDVLITERAMAHAVSTLHARRSSLRPLYIEDFTNSASEGQTEVLTSAPGTESDLALIIYTSGTTGKPKGAMLSHGNLLANVESCRQVLETAEQDRMAILLPMFHSFMLTVGILLPLLSGAEIVIVKSLHPAKNIVEEIIARRITILPAVPQFFRALSHPTVPVDLPLRLCVSGGAPLPMEILREFTRKFPSIPLVEGYGLSEASPVVSINPIHGEKRAGSIGLPIPGVEMSIQNDRGQVLDPSETGELCVRGNNVMLGYWNLPAATAETMRGDWLLTGDIGHRDADGYYFITDRKKDMILVNGINVYPRQIEEALYQILGVKEAAVVGVHDPRKGEHPVAFIVVDEGTVLEEAELQRFLRHQLAEYKVPHRIWFVEQLPHNDTGKILKRELRQKAAEMGTKAFEASGFV